MGGTTFLSELALKSNHVVTLGCLKQLTVSQVFTVCMGINKSSAIYKIYFCICVDSPAYLPVACQHEDTFEICRMDSVSFELYQLCTPGFLRRCTSCCFELFF